MTKQYFRKPIAGLMIVVWLTSLTLPSFAAPLPDLGDASSAIVSPDQEYRLGRAWLRQLRAQVPLIHDPLIYDYLYNLVYRLASASDIERPDIALVVINNAAINAFAVPGGVMGLNGGLLLNARTEDEVGGVIAHELAHLSQRHFARGVERSQQNSWAGLAALLASIAIAATAGGEAGMAALATTQAASIDAQLRFSRANEQEADRIGMQTLVRADMNPAAMADFFEALQRSMRYYGDLPPEFLLTHPVTESRITDARARAAQLPAKPSSDSLEFHLMKMRVEVEFTRDASAKISDLENQKQEEPKPAPKEAPSEAFSDLLKQEMEAIKQDEAEAMPAAESSETAQQLDEILQYKAIIQQTMKRYWARPPSARNGMVVTLSISLLPGGEVKSVVIDRSSGNSAFDNAAVQAVQKAGRFSVPPDPQLFDRHFRNFKMRFKPDDLRY